MYLGHHKYPEKRHVANLYVSHFPGGLLQAHALLWNVLSEKEHWATDMVEDQMAALQPECHI